MNIYMIFLKVYTHISEHFLTLFESQGVIDWFMAATRKLHILHFPETIVVSSLIILLYNRVVL